MKIEATVTGTRGQEKGAGKPLKLDAVLVSGETDAGQMLGFPVPISQARAYPVGRRVKITVEPV